MWNSVWSFLRNLVRFFSWSHRRRAALQQKPFPAEWRAIIDANVPYLRRLPEADHRELEGHIQVFLAEKRFEGAGGLELTDEIRVTIAAQACLLLLRRESDYYPDLMSIVVYPRAFVVKNMQMEGGIVTESHQVRLGESWDRGLVVLSWDSVRHGASDIRDGQNVVLHEFAHQLDQAYGPSDGAPELPCQSLYTAWARVLGKEYEALIDAVDRNRKTVMDDYGATSPPEFFAVATETFFEKPLQLRGRHPELYEQLKLYYQQDPATLLQEAKRK